MKDEARTDDGGNAAIIQTDIIVELKVIHADGTEEMIGEFPVYQAVEADAPSD